MNTTTTTQNTSLITGTYLVIENAKVQNLVIGSQQISGSKYINVNFVNVTFENCDFQGTEITNCNFIDCKFVNCNFNFSKFTNCSLIACELDNCHFCITNSLNCNYLACTFINNKWEESPIIDAKFEKCLTNADAVAEVTSSNVKEADEFIKSASTLTLEMAFAA